VVAAAEAEKSPAILQVTEKTISKWIRPFFFFLFANVTMKAYFIYKLIPQELQLRRFELEILLHRGVCVCVCVCVFVYYLNTTGHVLLYARDIYS